MEQKPHRETSYNPLFKRLMAGTVIFSLCLLSIFSYSKTARAGLLSFMASIVSSDQVSAQVSLSDLNALSSENMDLPSYAASINPNAPLADIDPIEGDVLMPDIAATNEATNTEPLNTQISSYIVQDGDTLSGIANIFGISADTIRQANGISGNAIHPGQTLTILPVSGVLYTVKSGDTLLGISKKYKANSADILTYNGLTASSTLSQGEQLVIPNVKPLTSATLSIVSHQKVPSFEPLLDDISSWPSLPGFFACPVIGARLTQGLHGHNAVDLAAPLYTPIRASAAGTVIVARINGAWNGAYGNFILISHGSTETLYAHMAAKSKGLVSVGQHVSQGEIIGYIGMTGLTTGPHIHFEVRGAQNPFASVSCN